jgi:hypothetical protein
MTGGFTAGYTVKDIAPRLLTGFGAANLSLLLTGKAISTANALSAALAGQGLNPSSAGAVMQTLALRLVSTGGAFLVLLGVFILILALLLAGIYVMRLMLVVLLAVLLAAVAPLALACRALPQTQGIARWWWRALAGTLLIQAGIYLTVHTLDHGTLDAEVPRVRALGAKTTTTRSSSAAPAAASHSPANSTCSGRCTPASTCTSSTPKTSTAASPPAWPTGSASGSAHPASASARSTCHPVLPARRTR